MYKILIIITKQRKPVGSSKGILCSFLRKL